MSRRDLLAAIASLRPIRLQGTFERHTSLRREELKPSAAGGRWGARRAYEVLYLGRSRSSVVIEAYRHLVDDELDDTSGALAGSVLERRLVTCKVDIPNILDLRRSRGQTLPLQTRLRSPSMGRHAPPAGELPHVPYAIGRHRLAAGDARHADGQTVRLDAQHHGPRGP